MLKTTYLFGAGASCEVMPLNNEIPERLIGMVKKINKITEMYEEEERERKEDLVTDLNWLWKSSLNHASVDTFAKKLYIQQKWQELKRLRLAMAVFFACEQMGRIPDRRYDAFFASILKSSIVSLPKNLNVLSWNYDYQFELSFMGFSDMKNVKDTHSFLGCVDKHQSYFENEECFKFFKLNGDISLREGSLGSKTYPILKDFSKELNADSFKEILHNWSIEKTSGGDFCCSISFAWEKEGNRFLEYVVKQIEESEILVVIGYSFPFFNREIDRILIGGMKKLTKVYLQAPDANDLAERFLAVDNRVNLEIVSRFDKHQFLIPNEF